jgi:hypothetical protein
MSKVENIKEENVIGEFKTSRKYEKFVSSSRTSKVRLFRDFAFLDGGVLSGMLEGVSLKLTVRDDSTVDFEEVGDANITDKGMLKRLLDQIDDMGVINYSHKHVVNNLTFKDEDGSICYLGVNHQTPMDKLNSIFEEDDKKIEMSDRSKSILSSLLESKDFNSETTDGEDSTEDLVDDIEEDIEQSNETSTYASLIKESFESSKKEKLEELKLRISESVSDINRFNSDKKVLDKKIDEITDGLSVLEKRLDSMNIKQEPNGLVFFVSEEKKSDIGLTEANREIADKIADLINLKKEVLFEQLTEGYFEISIAKSDDISNKEFQLDTESLESINSIDYKGKISVLDKNKIKYQGDLNWHQLVDKMIRTGFVQDEKFDELSGSNSYNSEK